LLNHKALELLRRLYDKAEIGIILAGMPQLIENIRGIRSEFPQLYTRVGASMKLGLNSQSDTHAIVSAHLDVFSEKLIDFFHNRSKQNSRHLSMLIFQTIRISEKNNTPITEDVIKKAASIIEV